MAIIVFAEETDALEEELLRVSPAGFPEFLKRHGQDFIRGERPWTEYMRGKFREKDILQQNVFLAADIPEKYGYRLISGEKRTRKRDTILRLCLAAEFTLQEVQESLILYGMPPLYARIPRDAAFILAFRNRIYGIHEVDAILRENNLPPFLTPDQAAGNL